MVEVIKKINSLLGGEKIRQSDLAKKLNLSARTVSLKLNGKVDFKLKEIERIAELFDVPLSYFFN